MWGKKDSINIIPFENILPKIGVIQIIRTSYNKPSPNPDNTHYIMNVIKKLFLGY